PYSLFGQRGRDRAQRQAFPPPCSGAFDCRLLFRDLDEPTILIDAPAEGDYPAEVPSTRTLIRLHVPHALADSVSLGFGDGGQNREDELRYAVAGNVPAEVDHV